MKHSTASRPSHLPSGFTLLEIVIVLGIIAILMGGGIYGMKKIADKTKKPAAESRITSLVSALGVYKLNMKRYPTTQEGLQALVRGKYLDSMPKDPWDRDYIYRFPGKADKSRPEIISLGEDGQEGTEDDINSQDL